MTTQFAYLLAHILKIFSTPLTHFLRQASDYDNDVHWTVNEISAKILIETQKNRFLWQFTRRYFNEPVFSAKCFFVAISGESLPVKVTDCLSFFVLCIFFSFCYFTVDDKAHVVCACGSPLRWGLRMEGDAVCIRISGALYCLINHDHCFITCFLSRYY